MQQQLPVVSTGISFSLPSPLPGISIVIEGLDGTGKTTVTSALAAKMNAALLQTPPPLMRSYRSYFDRVGGAERKAYYMVGNFMAAEQMKEVTMSGGNVVMDRYYASTIAYIVGKCTDIPPQGSDVYTWPEELARPSHMFYLALNEEERLRRIRSRVSVAETAEECQLRSDPAIGERINRAFEAMGCTHVRAEGSVEEIVDHIVQFISSAMQTS